MSDLFRGGGVGKFTICCDMRGVGVRENPTSDFFSLDKMKLSYKVPKKSKIKEKNCSIVLKNFPIK